MRSPKLRPHALHKQALQDYERLFRCKVPQWVQSLSNTSVRSVLRASERLGWELPTTILVETEYQSGSESLWADRQIRLDFFSESQNMGAFVPKDLQDLPIDPAEAATILCSMKGSLKMGKVTIQPMAEPNDPIYTGELMIGARLTAPAGVSPSDQKPRILNDASNSETEGEDSKPEKDQK